MYGMHTKSTIILYYYYIIINYTKNIQDAEDKNFEKTSLRFKKKLIKINKK